MKKNYLMLVFILFAMLGMSTSALHAQTAKNNKAAFVVNADTLAAGFDKAIFDRLLSLGYDVRVVSGGEVGVSFTKADAEELDLLVFSESIGSGQAVPMAGAAVPILHMESWGWNKMGWTESAGRGWTATNGYIDISKSAHTILSNAGLASMTDSLSWFTVDSLDATSIWPSSLPAGAKILAGKDTLVYSWTVEKGIVMADGNQAPARIATFPLPGYPTATYEASVLTDEGWSFFDAAVAWLGSTPEDFIGSAAFVVNADTLAAGFDKAIFDKLLSLGYDVRVVSGGEVGVTFTKADAEELDLLVFSESIGSGQAVPLAGAAVPILHMESWGWNKMGWTESAGRGWTPTNGYIDVSKSAHTILSNAGLASLTDSLMWFTVDSLDATSIWPTSLPAGAKILAGKDTLVYSWTVEQGVVMADGNQAPARIATFPLPGYPTATYEASVLTDAGWDFFEAAVAWLGSTPEDFIGSAAFVVNADTLAAGFDKAVFDRLLSLGYDVEVVPGGEVGVTFTKANAESKDLLVFSESIGSGQAVPLAGAAVPIMHMESWGWNKMGWTESAGRGWTPTNGYIDVSKSAHTILSNAGLASLTDSLSWFTVDSLDATSIWPTSLPAGAKILAGKDTLVYSWTVEQGIVMADGNQAPARIATFPLPGYPTATYEASVLTDEGWSFFDAAVAWLGSTPEDFIGSAAFVVNADTLAAGFDKAVFDRLLSLGYDVEVVPGGEVGVSFTKASAESKDLLVFSESIGSGQAVPLAGAAVPIMHMESWGWNKMGWTESAGRGWTPTNGYIDVSKSAHTILSNAGLASMSDSLMWFTVDSLDATSIWPTSLPAGAKILAGKDTLVYSWTVEQGIVMADGNQAPARIATFPLPGYPTATYEASVLTDEGWSFFDAAIAWLGATPEDFIGSAAFVVNADTLAAGFDGAIYNRLLSLGYDVEVVPGGEVGVTFTKADAESKDLLVFSESIGSGQAVPLAGAAVNIMHMESWGWNKMGWTESAGRGWTPTNGYIDISNSVHTILSNAGLESMTDSLMWFTVDSLDATSIWPTSLPAGAKILAGKDTLVYSWTVEKGIIMADGNQAPARIATFPLPGYPTATYEASVLTDEGWNFFDAAVLWLTPPPSTGEIEPGIVSRYEFETGADDKEGNFKGSMMGDAVIFTDLERGKVLSLTDTGYVSIDPALANELKDFSISTWVKGLGTAEYAGLLGIGQSVADTSGYWDIHLRSDGSMSFYASKDSVWPPDGSAQIVDDFVNLGDDWYHIAVTFKKGDTAMVYINGEAQTTSAWAENNNFDVTPMDVAAQMVAIGKDAYTQSTLTNTLIDNFTVYNIAISADKVKSIYDSEMHVEAPKLVAEYVFDYDAKDATGSYDGTLQGDAKLARDDDRGPVLMLSADGYVSLPPEVTDYLDDFSISSWVKGVGSNEFAALLGMGSSTPLTLPSWAIQLNGDSTMSFASSLANITEPDGCAQVVDDFTNDGSAWNHIVLAFTKNEGAVVYINGEAATTTALAGENDFSVSPSDLGAIMVAIGKDAFTQQTLTNTLIDDFKIYKNAITADDVKEIFKNETPEPKGGGGSFTYSLNTSVLKNNGGADFDNYDGFWSHENGNDEWDGTGIGEGAPGGISIVDNYYRLQDAGDPTLVGFPDPSSRKLQGYCDLSAFGGSPTMLDDGATIHFIARIPTDGPLDSLVNADGSRSPYPEIGNGYTHHNDGSLGMIGIKQGNGGYIGITLRTDYDSRNNNGADIGVFSGLQLPPAMGSSIITGTDISAADTVNTIALDPTEWHDYWVNIKKDESGVGTHEVSISVDGGEFQTFSVTATSHANYGGMPVLRMGLGNTGMSGAIDIKAFDFAPGLLPPQAIPAAHWKFEGDATDVYEISDGTLEGGDSTSYVAGLEGQGMALDLPGTVRYIEVPDNEVVDVDTSSFTYSMLVQTPDFEGDRELIFKGDNDDAVDGHWYALAIHGTNLTMYIDDKVTKTQWENPNIDQVLVAGQWNHLVVMRDREQAKLFIYINGVEYNSTADLTAGSLSSPGLPFRIGSNAAGDATAQTMMDEVQLFRSALSAEEVAALYATYVAQLPGNLKAYWKLDGDATDHFETSDGTLVGGDSANYVPGHTDQALDLSIGTDPTYVEVTDNSIVNVGMGEFTYSTLLHVTDLDSDRKILHKGSTDNAWYALSLDGSELSFAIDDGTNETSVVVTDAHKHLYDTTWNHIAAIRDRVQDSIFLYINQRIAGSAKANTDASIGSALPLIIGAGENMDAKFNGMLDEIRFYDEPIAFTDLQSLSRKYGIDPKYIPSSNANLATIQLAPAAPLTPAFAPDVNDYTCGLPAGTQSVRVTAFPADFKSTVEGTGNIDVSSGTGRAELVVTAEDGTVNTYTIDFSISTGIEEHVSADLNVIYSQVENSLVFENRDHIDRVEIFNINGSKLYVQENISSGRLNLNPANLPGNAIYIARVYAEDEFSVTKFVKLSSY